MGACAHPDPNLAQGRAALEELLARKTTQNTLAFYLDIKQQYEVNEYLIEHELSSRPASQAKFANRTLFGLWRVVHEQPTINYFLERDESLDKVLQIFIRVNSGGTPLSYSDLLLSMATAGWKKLDAREEINGFVDELNATGDGFNFNNDFVLKSCLVLEDSSKNIAFKVDNFDRDTMLKIEASWENIKTALRQAVTLVAALGFSAATLTANNAVIPIAYHLLHAGLPANFDQAAKFAGERAKIRQWLILSLLKRVFGGQADSVLRKLRNILATAKGTGEFPLEKIREGFQGTPKSLSFSEDDVENLLESCYGQGYTFTTLALLYPTLDFRNKFHVDHIFPRSTFTHTRLVRKGVTTADVDWFIEQADLLPNLQLLEGTPNQEKSNADFADWVQKRNGSKQTRAEYLSKNYIPDVDLSWTNFQGFITERRVRLKKKIAELVAL